MKSTGMTRLVDELGRVVIPKEIRKLLDIEDGKSMVEIFIDGDFVMLKKYQPGCAICGEAIDIRSFSGIRFCEKHWNMLKQAAREAGEGLKT